MINIVVAINNNIRKSKISHCIPKIFVVISEFIYRFSSVIHFSNMIATAFLPMYIKTIYMTFVIESHCIRKTKFIMHYTNAISFIRKFISPFRTVYYYILIGLEPCLKRRPWKTGIT